MEFSDLVKQRRSIRRYQSTSVAESDIEAVVEAARLAPSWGNRQCWRYIVVTDPTVKEKLSAAANQKWLIDAPVFIAACADPDASGHKPGLDYFMLDTGISFEHLILAATERGLGTCWIGAFDEDQAKEAMGVPEGIRVVAFTPLGYPAEKKGEVSGRKSLQEICFHDKYSPAVEINGQRRTIANAVKKLYYRGRNFGRKLRNRLAF